MTVFYGITEDNKGFAVQAPDENVAKDLIKERYNADAVRFVEHTKNEDE